VLLPTTEANRIPTRPGRSKRHECSFRRLRYNERTGSRSGRSKGGRYQIPSRAERSRPCRISSIRRAHNNFSTVEARHPSQIAVPRGGRRSDSTSILPKRYGGNKIRHKAILCSRGADMSFIHQRNNRNYCHQGLMSDCDAVRVRVIHGLLSYSPSLSGDLAAHPASKVFLHGIIQQQRATNWAHPLHHDRKHCSCHKRVEEEERNGEDARRN